METITSEKIKKLKHKFLAEAMPLAKQLWKEGKNQREVLDIVHGHVNDKIKKFYRRPYPENLRVDFLQRISKLESKAEAIVYVILEKNKIDFKTQRKIGPYRADFLIKDFLILEIDGPHHGLIENIERDKRRDDYLKKMGYEILCLPIWVFAVDEKAVIEEINEILQNDIF